MDTPLKKRRFWQLHLSTAVLMMFGAGGFLWVSMQVNNADELRRIALQPDRHDRYLENDVFIDKGNLRKMLAVETFGWPIKSYSASNDYGLPSKWHWLGLAADIAVGVAFVMTVAVASERLICRREGRKP